MYRKSITCLLATTLLVTACATGKPQSQQRSTVDQHAKKKIQSSNVIINFQVDEEKVFESRSEGVQDLKSGLWIPLENAAKALDMTSDWNKDKGSLRMGYTDVLYETTLNQPQALSGENKIQLSNAPKLINGRPYITVQALSELWQTPVKFDANRRIVQITPMDYAEGEPEGPQLPEGLVPEDAEGTQGSGEAQPTQPSIQSQSNINMLALIQYSRRFLGTPYVWGSSSRTTRTFDCSSYVQHVYRHFGIILPRGARDQSKRGYRVAYRNLKKGDLMFFWVHRRAVGHVGIYAGNGKVIHTFGKGGVKYSNIRSGYWKRHFFFAKRIA